MRFVILLLLAGCTSAQGEAGVTALEKWSKTICACKDMKCAQDNTLAMKTELDAIEGKGGKISDSQTKRLVELGEEIARCITTLKASITAWPADAEQKVRAASTTMAGYAKKICACKNPACVKQERAAWADAMKPYASLQQHPGFLRGVTEANQQLDACNKRS
jgi:hypothetical protein